ncbi:unnamed protein product [Caenorhabditis angaria]|uniref:C-type lectin domain-containing protein n=1 Tax=Caenorhabditis angaria TaxID=860376 RepID=A0A9P1INP7_9PELO|nr:unnamed protein product [Caenorhabditis angaria]
MICLFLFIFFLTKSVDFYHVYDRESDTLTVVYERKCGSSGRKAIQVGDLLRIETTTRISITTTEDRTQFECQDKNWTLEKRDGYNWCWQIFWKTSKYKEASENCLNLDNAFLSGIQNEIEGGHMADKFSKKISREVG